MEFDREEEAFRRAFAESLEGEAFRPLDPDAIKAIAPAPSRQPARFRPLAAAAAVVLVVGGAGLILPRLLASSDSATSAGLAPAAEMATANGVSVDQAGLKELDPTLGSVGAVVSDVPLSARTGAAVGWAGDEFYLVGGSQGQLDGARFNPSTGAWQALPSAPSALGSTPAVTVGDRLYFTPADRSTTGATYEALVFDTANEKWLTLAVPAGDLAAGDQLFSVGSTVQVFDPIKQSWQVLPSDPLPAGGKRSVVATEAGAAGSELVLQQTAGAGQPVRLAVLDVANERWRVVPESDFASGPVVRQGQQLYFGSGAFDLQQWTWRSLTSELPDLTDAVPFGTGSLYAAGVVVDLGDGTSRELPVPVSLDSATVVGGPTGLLVVGAVATDSSHPMVAFLLNE